MRCQLVQELKAHKEKGMFGNCVGGADLEIWNGCRDATRPLSARAEDRAALQASCGQRVHCSRLSPARTASLTAPGRWEGGGAPGRCRIRPL
jgi:hypothetical protein